MSHTIQFAKGYCVRENIVLMQTEVRFLGQPVDLETPNCAPPQNTAGANRDDIIMKHVCIITKHVHA